MAFLQDSTYGKNNVKFLKVKRDPSNPQIHQVLEATVRVLLTGAFDISYTKADNSVIIPTDTIKNTILIEAKKTDVFPIERFAAHLVKHFLGKYSWIDGITVNIEQAKWSKYSVDGKLQPHSFVKDGEEVRVCELAAKRDGSFSLLGGVQGLTVLKSSGSMFHGYNVCDYTTLAPVWERILSTDVDCKYKYDSRKIGSVDAIFKLADSGLFDKTFESALKVTLDRFALENSASVQATMYNMGTDIVEANPYVYNVSYALPNKHYILFDFAWKGLKNENELFYPSPHPNGLIKCTVGREPVAKL
ncbi:DEKNAAC103315 [Brettanomyces naardenensis]|uniref:Uricase n=1 Tax=Brettanomyces naardenensis TaxID=13370 RepID=A0A448YNN9_BRENA|nr:DEKNAAC103315 [Brettanomyces naardenensis]